MATIDTSIYGGIKPVQIEDPMNQFARQQELGVNMLKARELQQAAEDRNMLRQIDPSDPEYLSKVARVNPKLGAELGKSRLEADEKRLKMAGDSTKMFMDVLPGINDPKQMAELTIAQYNDPYLGPVLKRIRPLEQALSTIPTDPQGFAMYKQKVGMGMKDFYTHTTLSEAQKQTIETTRRGQDMQRIPVGYRQTATGEIEPIPGGPTTTTLSPKEIQAREAKFPQATLAVKSFDSKSDSVLKDIERLRNHPGLSSITGIAAGRLPGVTAQGREALELYEKIVSGLQFKELQDMRNASPTGGALGNVSNQEGQQLRQAAGALSRVQEAGSVQNELDRIADSIRGSKGRVREAYDMTYDYKAPATSGGAAPGAPAGEANNDPLGLRKR